MRTNQEAIQLIKRSESFSSYPYLCPAGIPTIGYGTTFYPDGRKVTLKDEAISLQKGLEYLHHEIDEKEEVLFKYLEKIKFKATSNEFSALTSFVYNCGLGPVVEGGRSLNIALKSGDRKAVADALLLYVKGTKKILGISKKVTLPGLVTRRQAERTLFLS